MGSCSQYQLISLLHHWAASSHSLGIRGFYRGFWMGVRWGALWVLPACWNGSGFAGMIIVTANDAVHAHDLAHSFSWASALAPWLHLFCALPQFCRKSCSAHKHMHATLCSVASVYLLPACAALVSSTIWLSVPTGTAGQLVVQQVAVPLAAAAACSVCLWQ